jgi:MFS transporter, DHA1 family, multidrug resistance protein
VAGLGNATLVSLALGVIFAYLASAPSLFMRFHGLPPNAFFLFSAGSAFVLS